MSSESGSEKHAAGEGDFSCSPTTSSQLTVVQSGNALNARTAKSDTLVAFVEMAKSENAIDARSTRSRTLTPEPSKNFGGLQPRRPAHSPLSSRLLINPRLMMHGLRKAQRKP